MFFINSTNDVFNKEEVLFLLLRYYHFCKFLHIYIIIYDAILSICFCTANSKNWEIIFGSVFKKLMFKQIF